MWLAGEAGGSRAAPAVATRVTGWVTHELYYWHYSGLESFDRSFQPRPSQETPESKRRLDNLVKVRCCL